MKKLLLLLSLCAIHNFVFAQNIGLLTAVRALDMQTVYRLLKQSKISEADRTEALKELSEIETQSTITYLAKLSASSILFVYACRFIYNTVVYVNEDNDNSGLLKRFLKGNVAKRIIGGTDSVPHLPLIVVSGVILALTACAILDSVKTLSGNGDHLTKTSAIRYMLQS